MKDDRKCDKCRHIRDLLILGCRNYNKNYYYCGLKFSSWRDYFLSLVYEQLKEEMLERTRDTLNQLLPKLK